MRRVGLVPSDPGGPGGKQTGQQMDHFIVPGGPFEEAARKLVGDGYELSWSDAALRIADAAGQPR